MKNSLGHGDRDIDCLSSRRFFLFEIYNRQMPVFYCKFCKNQIITSMPIRTVESGK
jgi:hypothetical protein